MKNLPKQFTRHTIAAPLVALLLVGATAMTPALAQAPTRAAATGHDSHHAAGSASASATTTATADPTALSEGEITRWDARTLRITVRHGEIKNLEMPPMTMVFRVQDAGVLGDLTPGDKVRFRAEQVSGAYHVTRIEKAP